MKSNIEFDNSYLWDPTVFRPGFNENKEILDANRAWSLFFTAGQEDTLLGLNPEVGRFLTNVLIAIVVAGAIGGAIFTRVL